jgi:hypothetical protein
METLKIGDLTQRPYQGAKGRERNQIDYPPALKLRRAGAYEDNSAVHQNL